MSVAWLKSAKKWDLAGIGLSLVCWVHCLLLPLLPFFVHRCSGSHHHRGVGFHALMVVLVVGVALVAFYRGFLRHRRPLVLALALVGVALLTAGVMGPAAWESGLTLLGVTSMGGAHFANLVSSPCCSGPV